MAPKPVEGSGPGRVEHLAGEAPVRLERHHAADAEGDAVARQALLHAEKAVRVRREALVLVQDTHEGPPRPSCCPRSHRCDECTQPRRCT
eukprot:3394498-Heterocapsa_arctica.AAC.1